MDNVLYTWVQIHVWHAASSYFGICPEVELLHHTVVLFDLLRNYMLFPTAAASFHILTSNAQGSNLSTSLPALVIISCYFYDNQPNGCKVVFHYGLFSHCHFYFNRTKKDKV